MIIGIPKEIKPAEFRVGMVPAGVKELVAHGHTVVIESHAAEGININDEEYQKAGADIVPNIDAVYSRAELIVKVKEPQPAECQLLQEHHTLFTFLHLAADPVQAKGLMKSGCTAIAYETVTDIHGRLPLLSPMSEVAGRLSIQAGARALEKSQGGRGILLSGVPGVDKATVLIIGGGVVGSNAARMAIGLGAKVILLDSSIQQLRALDQHFNGELSTIFATQASLAEGVQQADLVIGAVLVPGGAAPKLMNRSMLQTMRRGAVMVDVSIDQGGCFETSQPTTHHEPTYIVDDIVHYCVTNMPGAVPRTSTFALNNATLPYIIELADKGTATALIENSNLANGLNIQNGQIVHEAVRRALGAVACP